MCRYASKGKAPATDFSAVMEEICHWAVGQCLRAARHRKIWICKVGKIAVPLEALEPSFHQLPTSACGCLEVICPEQNWTECAPDIGRTQMISPIHYSRNCLSALGQMLERIDINRHSLAQLGMSHATKLMIN